MLFQQPSFTPKRSICSTWAPSSRLGRLQQLSLAPERDSCQLARLRRPCRLQAAVGEGSRSVDSGDEQERPKYVVRLARKEEAQQVAALVSEVSSHPPSCSVITFCWKGPLWCVADRWLTVLCFSFWLNCRRVKESVSLLVSLSAGLPLHRHPPAASMGPVPCLLPAAH